MKDKMQLALFVILFGLIGWGFYFFKYWEVVDPIVTMGSFGGIGYLIYRYVTVNRNPGEPGVGDAYIVFETTNPIVATVEAQIKTKVDRVVSTLDVLGAKEVKTAEDCKKMISALHDELMSHIGKNIHLFYAGPPSILLDVGRLIGMHHIPHNHLTVYMWVNSKYVPLSKLI